MVYEALLSESGHKRVATTINELRDDEVDTLLALLTKHAQRDPKDGEVYQAFLKLVGLRPTIMPSFSSLVRRSLLPNGRLPTLELDRHGSVVRRMLDANFGRLAIFS